MKKIWGLILGILVGGSAIFSVYSSVFAAMPADITLPQYRLVSCNFTQVKTIPNSAAEVKSGGIFKYRSDNGVIFETTYPVRATVAYTTEQSKKIAEIISAITRKDSTYLNQNFDLYYIKNEKDWRLSLTPKKTSKTASVMQSIIIEGAQYINQIDINTIKSGNTKINFTGCTSQ